MSVEDNIDRAMHELQARVRISKWRRKARVYRRCFVAMTLTSLIAVSGVFLSNADDFRSVSGASPAPSGDRELVWSDSVNDSKVTQHINNRRETAWCLYGTAGSDTVRVDRVKWVGRYGTENSISWSPSECGLQGLGSLVGTMHSHPNRFEPELSLTDVHSFGARTLSSVKAVSVLNEDEVVLKAFGENSLRNGFGEVVLER